MSEILGPGFPKGLPAVWQVGGAPILLMLSRIWLVVTPFSTARVRLPRERVGGACRLGRRPAVESGKTQGRLARVLVPGGHGPWAPSGPSAVQLMSGSRMVLPEHRPPLGPRPDAVGSPRLWGTQNEGSNWSELIRWPL